MRRKKEGRSEVAREAETLRGGRMGGLVSLAWTNQDSATGQSEYSIHQGTICGTFLACAIAEVFP